MNKNPNLSRAVNLAARLEKDTITPAQKLAHLSDSPLTDGNTASEIGFYSCATVPAVFARGLERKLNATAAQRDELADALDEALLAMSVAADWLARSTRIDDREQAQDLRAAMRAAIARAEGKTSRADATLDEHLTSLSCQAEGKSK